jgi:hypothetical protein
VEHQHHEPPNILTFDLMYETCLYLNLYEFVLCFIMVHTHVCTLQMDFYIEVRPQTFLVKIFLLIYDVVLYIYIKYL